MGFERVTEPKQVTNTDMNFKYNCEGNNEGREREVLFRWGGQGGLSEETPCYTDTGTVRGYQLYEGGMDRVPGSRHSVCKGPAVGRTLVHLWMERRQVKLNCSKRGR